MVWFQNICAGGHISVICVKEKGYRDRNEFGKYFAENAVNVVNNSFSMIIILNFFSKNKLFTFTLLSIVMSKAGFLLERWSLGMRIIVSLCHMDYPHGLFGFKIWDLVLL